MWEWITANDVRLIGLSFAWIISVIVVSEGLRRVFRWPSDVSRKVVHVLVAAWALPTALLFTDPWMAAVTPGVFVFLNALSYKFRLMDLIEEEGRGSAGTIYFPISFCLLIIALWPWDGRGAMVAGLFAMGFGDAAASVFGRRFGRHRYRAAGGTKSWEGTAIMFVVSAAAILLGTWPVSGFSIPLALAAGAAAGMLEAPAGRGLDNLTVPLGTAGVYFLLQGVF